MTKITGLLFFLLVGNPGILQAQKAITIYDQLVQVNEQWKSQLDIDPSIKHLPAMPLNERELVQLHLRETENLLRKRTTKHLPAQLKKQRETNLSTLHAYWQKGVFPVNDAYQQATLFY